jgi:hypothetical protein
VVSYTRRILGWCASGLIVTTVLAAMIGVLSALAGPAYGVGALPDKYYGPKPCGRVELFVSPHNVTPGGKFTVTITGFCKNDKFTVEWRGPNTVLGTITTNSKGDGAATFSVPSGASYGSHAITIVDNVGNSASVNVTVVPPPGTQHCAAKLEAVPITVRRHATFELEISGTCDSDTFSAYVQSPTTKLGTIKTNTSGDGTGNFRVPEDLGNGQHAVWVVDANDQTAGTDIMVEGGHYKKGPNQAVLDGALIASSGPPPPHHSYSTLVAEVAAGVLLVGGWVTLRTRKRRFRQAGS